MEVKELIENLKLKLKEAKKIIDLSSKDFRFKSWQASTLTLLRGLPPMYKFDVTNFKKLSFEDTKYHRGNKFFSSGYDEKYAEDMDGAIKILKKITSTEIAAPKANVIKKAKKPVSSKKTRPAKKSNQAAKPKKSVKTKAPKSSSKPKKKTVKAPGTRKAPSRKTGGKPAKKPKK